MGYNAQASRAVEEAVYPKRSLRRLPLADKTVTPPELLSLDGGPTVTQILQVHLDRHNMIDKGTFVAVGHSLTSELGIGKIKSLWEVRTENGVTYFGHLDVYKLMDVDPYYMMRSLRRTDRTVTVNAKFFRGAVNVQHDCHGSKCVLDKLASTRKERQASQGTCWGIRHLDEDRYILNSASLHDPQLHERILELPPTTFSPAEWAECIKLGHHSWLGGSEVSSDDAGDSSDEESQGPVESGDPGGDEEEEANEPEDGRSVSEYSEGSSQDEDGSSQDEDAEGETDDEEEYDWGNIQVMPN
ncbi:hypothetical protein PGT21_037131 [Puccinia graminis f. sp. tritici]|uniref:Uncharacterized protein n=1 Tax=Puccinia graminis f. sp. tritici TaxID=56615 RepID=A0A5B0R3E6_PUCGR|nr:hypothetical protein PGT21_037131 [Puccinia graminis f. sp. tritici]